MKKFILAVLASLALYASAFGQATVNAPFPRGAWTTFSPTATCAGGTLTVNSASSLTVGKTTFVSYNITVATGTCTSTGSNISISLPRNAVAPGGSAGAYEYAGGTSVFCSILDSALTAIQCRTGANLVTSSRFSLSFVYPST